MVGFRKEKAFEHGFPVFQEGKKAEGSNEVRGRGLLKKALSLRDLLIVKELSDLSKRVSLRDRDEVALDLPLDEGVQNLKGKLDIVEFILSGPDVRLLTKEGCDQDKEVFVPDDSPVLEEPCDLPEVHSLFDTDNFDRRVSARRDKKGPPEIRNEQEGEGGEEEQGYFKRRETLHPFDSSFGPDSLAE
jgi:hypothetical protein